MQNIYQGLIKHKKSVCHPICSWDESVHCCRGLSRLIVKVDPDIYDSCGSFEVCESKVDL